MLNKQLTFHHSVTEFGNIQVRLVTQYVNGTGFLVKTYSDPYTPQFINNLAGFDDRSKEIVGIISTKNVIAELAAERKAGIRSNCGLLEQITHDRVIEPDGRIAVRRITRLFDNGKEVCKTYHRTWLNPGDGFINVDVVSKALAIKLHAPETIALYKTSHSNAFESDLPS